jgi:hypothetical protein
MRQRLPFVVATLLAALAAPALAQSGPPKADDLLAAARPHLEAVLGKRLDHWPVLRTVTSAELAALPDGLIDIQVAWQFPDLDPAARDRARQVATAALRGATVASLQEGTALILVAPDNARHIAGWDPSLARADSAAFLRLALVHETTRWQLDRELNLARRRAACRDSEEIVGLQAVIEGRCQWVTRQVARRLGEEAAFGLLAEAYRRAPDVEGDGRVRVLSRDVLNRRHWCCERGLAFFTYLDEQGVKDAEPRAFVHAPRQTAWIERPQLYLRAEQLNLGDLGEALGRLEAALPAAEWRATQQPWTAGMFKQAATLLGEEARAEKVAAGWDAGRLLVWSSRAHPGRQVTLGLLRFQDAAAARAYYGLAVDLQRKQDELLSAACAARACVMESRSEVLRLAGADEAMRTEKKVRTGEQSEPATITMAWVRAGERVIEFSWHGQPCDTAWAQRVLDTILKERP